MNLITKLAQLRTDVEKSIAETPPLSQPSTYLLDTVTKLRLIEYLSSNNPTNEPAQMAVVQATASNQLFQLERLIEIRDRLPVDGSQGIAIPARTTYQNLGVASSGVIKAESGKVFALTVYNMAASTRWIQLFNRNVLLTGGELPIETYPIFASNFLVLDSDYFGDNGQDFNTGIAFGFSDTGNSFTPSSDSFQLHLKYF